MPSHAITLRPASEQDDSLLLAWANDPVTRAAGFAPHPVTPDEHRAWLAGRLESRSSRLLIGMSGETPVGQVRLDREPGGRVEVGISVAPEARGQGVGRSLLWAALDEARRDASLGATGFTARIRPENTPSIALFTGAGFRQTGELEIDGLRCLLYEADA
jgi:RimJ/RimL family protein N-acetyltransferase